MTRIAVSWRWRSVSPYRNAVCLQERPDVCAALGRAGILAALQKVLTDHPLIPAAADPRTLSYATQLHSAIQRAIHALTAGGASKPATAA